MWPFKKKKTQKRAFSAAVYNRLVTDWVAGSTSADAELRGALPVLRNRARDFGRNNDYVREIYRQFQNNIAGEGIYFQAQTMMQRGGKLDEKQNDLIEKAWAKWCRKETCDVAGLLSFGDMQRLAIRSLIESGEVIVRKITRSFGNSKIPYALEIIESDMLDDNYNGRAANGNQIRFGVEVDGWKRPVAYYFFASHPGDNHGSAIEARSSNRRRIPASEIVHLYVLERPGQTRGFPHIVSAIMRLRHMSGYEEATVVSARAGAANMGFIETADGQPSIADDVQDGQTVSEFSPGVIKTLGPGEKFSQSNFQNPSGQFDPFMRAMLRGVASGCGIAYETISSDFSQSNYSSSRMAMLKERDNWRVMQKWFISNFCQPIFEGWLDMAVLSGGIPLKGYEGNEDQYSCVRWQPRGWAWIDPNKEVTANKEAVRNGFLTQADVIAASGGDIEELYNARRRELDRAKDLGLEFDTDPGVDAKGAEKGDPEPEDESSEPKSGKKPPK